MPTTIGDPAKTLKLARLLRAPREKVFRAWTDPEELKKWWGPKGYATLFAEIDLRVGGKYHIEMHTPEKRILHLTGSYVEVRPPECLVMTWSWQGTEQDDGYQSLVTVEFLAQGRETKIVLTHEGLPDTSLADYTGGWNSSFDCLEEHLPG